MKVETEVQMEVEMEVEMVEMERAPVPLAMTRLSHAHHVGVGATSGPHSGLLSQPFPRADDPTASTTSQSLPKCSLHIGVE